MARARWKGVVVAESEDVTVVDGYTYFPRSSVRMELLEPSEYGSVCPWKGSASYYSLVVDGARNADAVWEYRDPKPAAESVRGRLAFRKGVEVER